jgi:gliding motility-associated-like protein
VKDNGGVVNGGTDTKTITFDVTVLGQNSAPTLDFISDVNLLEDFAPTPIRLRNIRDGDDGSQQITITATSSNKALMPNPTINYIQGETQATLVYEPVAGQNGSTTITVTIKDDAGTANGGIDTYVVTFEISILGLNDRPTVNAVADTSLLEDSDNLIILLTGISDGDTEEVQKMSISATSSRPEILPDPTIIYDSVSTTAQLILKPAPNISGTSTITVTIKDDGGSLIAGQEDTRTITFQTTVLPVNDKPTINEIANVIRLLEGAETQRQLLTGITDGDPELIQSITSVTVSSNKPDFYETLDIAYREGDTNGELILKTDPNANGMDTLTITVTDNGGTENGGINTTTTTIFIDVLPLNDPPTINNVASIDNILKNSEGDCISLSGITDGDPELDQDITITATSNRPDIIPNPIISDFKPATGLATLCYELAPDTRGLVEITITLKDNGGLPGNDTRSIKFTIGVGVVNNPPVIIGENGEALEEVNLTTTKDVPLDICFQIIDRDKDEVDLGQIISRNADESGEIVAGSFTFKGDSLCFIYEAYPNTLSGADWFEFTICDDVPGDVACDTIRLNIEVLPSADLRIYDGISPKNSDGKNDAWFIEGIENYPNNVVQIYATSGELVYEANGYDNRDELWRGQSNTGISLGARELPTGVYYFVIDLGAGDLPPRRGSVIIK